MVFVFAMNGTLYSWIAGAIPRPPAKRAAAYAFINSIGMSLLDCCIMRLFLLDQTLTLLPGNSASIWTPYTYRTQDAPHYRPALAICIGLQVIAAMFAVWLRFLLVKENKALDRMANEDVTLDPAEVEKLRRTAELEGTSLAEARRLQKTYRYIV